MSKFSTLKIIGLIFLGGYLGASVAQPVVQPKNKSIYRHQRQLGSDLERLGQFDKAANLYFRLYKDAPDDLNLYRGIKRCLIQLGQFDRLEDFVKDEIKRSGKMEPRVDLGEVYYRRGNEKQAFQYWDDLIKQTPKNSHLYRFIGQAMTGLRLYDRAIDLYRRGREAIGKKELFVYELAELYVFQTNYSFATREYIRYLKTNPQQLTYVDSRLGSFVKSPEIVQEVEAVIKDEIKVDEKLAYYLNTLLAGIYLRLRNYDQAFEYYQILEKSIPKEVEQNKRMKVRQGNKLFSFAQAAQRDGAYEYAKKAYALVYNNYPKSQFAKQSQLANAQCLEQQGLSEEALIAYKDFLSSYPTAKEAAEAMFKIGEIYFDQKNDFERARETYQKIVKTYSTSPVRFRAMFRLADCLLVDDQPNEAEKVYQKILLEKNQQNSTVGEMAKFKTAQLYFYQGKFNKARELLDQLTTNLKPNQEGNVSTVVNDALELSFLIQENIDDQRSLKVYASSLLLMRQQHFEKALASLEKICSSTNVSITDDALMLLGSLQRRLGNNDEAMGAFTRVINIAESDLYKDQAQWNIAEIYETQLLDLKSAQRAYEELLVNYPNSVLIEEARRRIRVLDKKLKTDT